MAKSNGRKPPPKIESEEIGESIAASEPRTELGKVLGTDDSAQQIAATKLLMQPLITIVLIADPRVDQIQIVPITRAQLSVEQLQRLLHVAQEQLMRQVIEGLTKQANGGETPIEPLPASAPQEPVLAI